VPPGCTPHGIIHFLEREGGGGERGTGERKRDQREGTAHPHAGRKRAVAPRRQGEWARSEVRVFIVFIYSTLVLGLEMVVGWARF
jgi:hypothetical protein